MFWVRWVRVLILDGWVLLGLLGLGLDWGSGVWFVLRFFLVVV